MNEQNRESLSDSELSALLKKWVVAAPDRLEKRVIDARGSLSGSGPRRTWWQFLLKGTIRVPIPVACCLAVLMIAVLWRSSRLAVACEGAASGLQAVPAITATAAPAKAPRSVGSCAINSTC